MTVGTVEDISSMQSSLAVELAQIFNDCQHTTMSHRRNCIALKKLHMQPLNERTANSGGKTRAVKKGANHSCEQNDLQFDGDLHEWEANFFMEFFKITGIVLALKRSDDVAIRLVKFIHAFCMYSNSNCDNGKYAELGREMHGRLMENYIQCLLHGVEAKDKTVRYRVCLLLSGCINAVDEIRDDLLSLFVEKLSERLFDKESSVRVAAVQALSRLQEFVVEIRDDSEQVTVSSLYQNLLQYDSSVEVRKAVLSVLTFTMDNLDSIVERSQDENVQMRRLFFKKKMEQIEMKNLAIKQREQILHNGLLDRDSSVKEACIEMIFNNWLPATGSNIIQFLESLDVVSNTKVALESLRGFFEKYPKLFSTFPDSYFESLTVETAFIMRVYCEFVVEKQTLQDAQELLPEVIKFAQYLKNSCESFVALKISDNSNENTLDLMSYPENEFILTQLFHIGKILDYSDEVSRRFMISLLRDVLTVVETPASFIPDIVEFLFSLASDQSERIGIFSDIIIELYDDNGCSIGNTADDLSSSISQLTIKPNQECNEEVTFVQKLKSLSILTEFLKLHSSLDISQHPILASIFNEIVIFSINSPLAAIQEQGLECLGQFCLLHPTLSNEYFPLLIDFFRLGHAEIQVIALKILFDLLLLFKNSSNVLSNVSTVLQCAKTALCCDEHEELQSIAVEGCAKLLLGRVISDQSVLEGLALLYFHPSSINRPRIRQCLCYFFPAFAFSSHQNQLLFIPLFVPVILSVFSFQKQTSTNLVDTIIKPSQVAEQLFYWLDPTRVVSDSNSSERQGDNYGLVAIEMLKSSFSIGADQIKLLVQLLGRLKIDSSCNQLLIKKIDFLASNLLRNTSDKITGNNLRKFIASFIEYDDRTISLGEEELAELKEIINKN